MLISFPYVKLVGISQKTSSMTTKMKVNLRFFTINVIILSMLFSGLVLYKKINNKSACSEAVLTAFQNGKSYGPAYKVVVEPWNGPHNVYAVFMFPNEIKSKRSLVVNIPNMGTYCGTTKKVGTKFEGIQAKPGYYLVTAHLKTRTSALLIARGFLEQLKDPRNWSLV